MTYFSLRTARSLPLATSTVWKLAKGWKLFSLFFLSFYFVWASATAARDHSLCVRGRQRAGEESGPCPPSDGIRDVLSPPLPSPLTHYSTHTLVISRETS